MSILNTQPSYSTVDSVVNPFSGAIKLQQDLQHRLNRFVRGQAYTIYTLTTVFLCNFLFEPDYSQLCPNIIEYKSVRKNINLTSVCCTYISSLLCLIT